MLELHSVGLSVPQAIVHTSCSCRLALRVPEMEEGWPGYYAACYENNCAQPPFVHEMQRYNAEYYHDLQVAYYEAMERDNSWYRRESIRQKVKMQRSALISRSAEKAI